MPDAVGEYRLFYERGSPMIRLAEYVLSVISASVIGIIICSFFDEKSGISVVVKLIFGMFLTFVVINPVVRMDFSGIENYLEYMTLEGAEAASVGENMAREAEGEFIKSRVQAYILDKADSFGIRLNVEVVLDQENIPVSVELQGNISPYAKTRMIEIITEELGIAKENQLWIG